MAHFEIISPYRVYKQMSITIQLSHPMSPIRIPPMISLQVATPKINDVVWSPITTNHIPCTGTRLELGINDIVLPKNCIYKPPTHGTETNHSSHIVASWRRIRHHCLFGKRMHLSVVDFPQSGSDSELWCFSSLLAWTLFSTNSPIAGDLTRHDAHLTLK